MSDIAEWKSHTVTFEAPPHSCGGAEHCFYCRFINSLTPEQLEAEVKRCEVMFWGPWDTKIAPAALSYWLRFDDPEPDHVVGGE